MWDTTKLLTCRSFSSFSVFNTFSTTSVFLINIKYAAIRFWESASLSWYCCNRALVTWTCRCKKWIIKQRHLKNDRIRISWKWNNNVKVNETVELLFLFTDLTYIKVEFHQSKSMDGWFLYWQRSILLTHTIQESGFYRWKVFHVFSHDTNDLQNNPCLFSVILHENIWQKTYLIINFKLIYHYLKSNYAKIWILLVRYSFIKREKFFVPSVWERFCPHLLCSHPA